MSGNRLNWDKAKADSDKARSGPPVLLDDPYGPEEAAWIASREKGPPKRPKRRKHPQSAAMKKAKSVTVKGVLAQVEQRERSRNKVVEQIAKWEKAKKRPKP